MILTKKMTTTLIISLALGFAPLSYATHKTESTKKITAVQKEAITKAVYHINDSQVARGALYNIVNHLSVDPTAKITVVTHGKGIDFLLEGAKDPNGNPYDIQVEELQRKGVIFNVCKKTLETRHISEKDLIADVKLVPSGVAEIARLQAKEGFIYIKP